MILDRLREILERAPEPDDEDTPEHKAVVDLLVAVAFADHLVDHRELTALESFDASHEEWDTGTFSVHQYLPEAIARIRDSMDTPEATDRLLQDACSRITSPELRRDTLDACQAMSRADGERSDAESTLLSRIAELMA